MAETGRMGWLRVSWARRLLQTGILGSVVYLALGFGKRTFEAYCPFGGAEAAWSLFTRQAYTCTLSEMNLAMFLGVLALTVVAGKAFCGWACPIGFINEMLSKLGRRLPGIRRLEVTPRVDRWLRLLRYPLLILFLVLTWRAGELLLRGYDPFFLIFSGFGHGSLGVVSAISLGVVVIGTLFAPMLWCRYLCPLGAVMDGLARFGLVRIHRDAGSCTACGACDDACLQRLRVSDQSSLASVDCTRCYDCVEACGHHSLSLRTGFPDPRGRRRPWLRVTAWALPVLVAALLFAGVRAAEPMTLPTATATFGPRDALAQPVTATCTIQGVKCLGTSNLFIQRVATLPGVSEVETYAGLHKVVVTFDRSQISPQTLRDSIDAPVRHPVTGAKYEGVFTCTEMRVRE